MQNFNYNIFDVIVQVYFEQKKIGQEPHRGPKAKNGINRHFNKKTVFLCIHSVYFFHFSKINCLANIVVYCIIYFLKKPRNWAPCPKLRIFKNPLYP